MNTDLGLFLVREIFFLKGINIRAIEIEGNRVRFERVVLEGSYRLNKVQDITI